MTDLNEQPYRTLSAFFDTQHHADRAIKHLLDAGITKDRLRLVPGYENDTPHASGAELHGGFLAALSEFVMGDQDRNGYADRLTKGGFLVVVSDIDETIYDHVVEILNHQGAIDLDVTEEASPSLTSTDPSQAQFDLEADDSVEIEDDRAAFQRNSGTFDRG